MTRRSLASPWSFLLAALAWSEVGLAQEIRLGTEFQVNTYTTNSQSFASVATDADGDFVVAWHSNSQDGDSYGVFARRFSSAGTALATEFQVNTHTVNYQGTVSVAADADRDFVVVWSSFTQDGSNNGVFARRFSSAGAPLGTEFQVSTYTTNNQTSSSVSSDAAGAFVIAWTSAQDGDVSGIFARRFSAVGVALANEVQINTYTVGGQSAPSVALDNDGDFVVAWNSNGQDGSSYGVFARRFSSAGTPLAAELQVNSYTTDNQTTPSVSADADGDFVVAWNGSNQDGSSNGVFARRFSSAGNALGAELQVNSYTTGSQGNPSVGLEADGGFVVAWQSLQDGAAYGIFGRRFSSTGVPLATEFQVQTYTAGAQAFAAVAVDDGGRFVIAWHSNGQDGSNYGVFAQRFASPAVLDIDANGTTAPLSDGLLVLRYLFGFTGATLVSGAVDAVGCTRCTAPAIEAYLAGLV